MFRRKSLVVLALAGLLGFARPAHASIEMKSSMTAACTTAACDLITFVLSVPDQGVYTNAMVDIIRIRVLRSFFEIGAVQEIWHYVDGVKQTLSWNSTYTSDPWNPEVAIAMSSGLHAAQPIYLNLSFNSADGSHLTDGSVQYFANGAALNTMTGAGEDFSAGGQVTPEPITMILMGTGLLGVGGASRRRRKALQSV